MHTFCRWPVWLAPLSVVLLTSGAQQPWKDKQAAAWTAAEARQVLTDSPWAKPVTPKMDRPSNQRAPRDTGMGRNGGGINMGGGGMGGSRSGRGGMGGNIGGRNTQPRIPTADTQSRMPGQNPQQRQTAPRKPPTLTVRWESALPVQEAASKTKDSDGRYGDEEHYAVAVVGVPARMVSDSGKPKAELKRKGKKTIKSSSAEIVPRGNARMVVFLFPKGKQEIVAGDNQVEFNTRIGALELKQSFELSEMTYDGKLRI